MARPASRQPPSRRAAAQARRARKQPAKAPRRAPGARRRGPRIAVAAVLVLLLVLPVAALAWADRDNRGRIPAGTVIDGVDVGGLRADAALRRLRARIGVPAARAVRVTIDGAAPQILPAGRAGVSLDLRAAVRRAVARGQRGSFLTRGWRALTGARLAATERIRIDVDRARVKAFVDRLADAVKVPARAAALDVRVDAVEVTRSRNGRRLADPDRLTDRLVRSLRSLRSTRRLRARTEVVAPPATTGSLWEEHPTVVTVSRDEKLVRVFDRGKLTKRYQVAVGMPKYPTPLGTFAVQRMEKNPVWNVPNEDWAGALAGKTIPGGDPANPLKARFIGFSGAVGFHGTADIASLGSAASHGCIRMRIPDVKDLFQRVSVGTTVFVG